MREKAGCLRRCHRLFLACVGFQGRLSLCRAYLSVVDLPLLGDLRQPEAISSCCADSSCKSYYSLCEASNVVLLGIRMLYRRGRQVQ